MDAPAAAAAGEEGEGSAGGKKGKRKKTAARASAAAAAAVAAGTKEEAGRDPADRRRTGDEDTRHLSVEFLCAFMESGEMRKRVEPPNFLTTLNSFEFFFDFFSIFRFSSAMVSFIPPPTFFILIVVSE